MEIVGQPDDSDDFLELAGCVCKAILHRDAPPALVLIKVDNWFGSRWLGFSGTVLGAFGIRSGLLTIPPFVPNRIVSQRRFSAPLYDEVNRGESLHGNMPSKVALKRRVSEIADGAALLWYSGNSKENGRGCVMAYLPESDGSYRGWYAGWSKKEVWELVEAVGIKHQELTEFIGSLSRN